MQKKSKFKLFAFMMLIILGLTFQPAISTYAACPDDISSYWKLDETTAGTYADFINGKDGTGNVDPTPATGTVNGAQQFDSATSTGIDVPADRSFNWHGNESFSIEFWVKTDGVAPGTNQVVIGRTDAPMFWWVGIHNTDGLASFFLMDTNGNGGGLSGVGTISLSDGSWHHVVAVRDESTDDNIIYVDGVEQGRTNHDYTAGFGSNASPLYIGYSASAFYFDGLIDEVALYDRALSLTEIQQHHTAGLAGEDYCAGSAAPAAPNDAPFPDDTVSLWELNETTPSASGGTYADSFDGNDGTGNVNPTAAAGTVNGAQQFDSATSTGIDVPADRSFDWLSNESFSIEFWVKTDGVAPGTNQVVIGRTDAPMFWWVGIHNTDGLASFFLMDTNGNGGGLSGVGTISLSDGSWHHVVAVRDESTDDNIIYVDGVEQGRTNHDYTAGFGSNASPLYIGYSASAFYFDGLIDEVALYDRALLQNEIQEHYDAGLLGNGVQSLRPPPDANAGTDKTDVKELTEVTLDGTGSVEGYAAAPITTYLWQETTGSGVTINNADTATATFTAPDVAAAGDTLTFQLTVTADDGQWDSDTIDVGVVDRIFPVADAGPDQPNVTEGDTVTLDGTGSSDADGTITAYLWEEVTATGVTITNANTATASFTAPAAGTTLTFKLTVTDDDGQTDSDTMDVTVADASISPVANAGVDQDVTVGDTVTLDGTGSTGTGLTYAWIQGPVGTRVQLAGSDTATPTFTAPDASAVTAALLETLTFQLTVTDSAGLTSDATTNVNVDDGTTDSSGGGGGGGGGCFINSMF